jgi:hypothetical protein
MHGLKKIYSCRVAAEKNTLWHMLPVCRLTLAAGGRLRNNQEAIS